MGKYHFNVEYLPYEAIANELAEANRLKRLVLRDDHTVYDSLEEEEYKKALEDKA